MLCFDVNTKARQAAFLAQVGHESGGGVRLAENLHYSAQGLLKTWPRRFTEETAPQYAAHGPEAIANCVYAGRNGNRDEASGDGWKYRGRGLIQLTGRENYRDCGNGISMDLLAKPDMLSGQEGASMSAAWFWWSRNLNTYADIGDFTKITAIINGGQNGQDDRIARWKTCKQTLGVA